MSENKNKEDRFVVPAQPTGGLTGRATELKHISEMFSSGNATALSLHGEAGIGKATLAGKLATYNTKSFDLVYTIDCAHAPGMEELLYELSAYFGRVDVGVFDNIIKNPAPLELKVNFIAQIVNKLKMLLILRDMDAMMNDDGTLKDEAMAAGLAGIINQAAHGGHGSKIIFTSSRDLKLTGVKSGLMKFMNLPELSKNDAYSLMSGTSAYRDADNNRLAEIYKETGGSPLKINFKTLAPDSDSIDAVIKNLSDKNKSALNAISGYGAITRLDILNATAGTATGRLNTAISAELDELEQIGLVIKLTEQGVTSYRARPDVREQLLSALSSDERRERLVLASGLLIKHAQSPLEILRAIELQHEAGELKAAAITSIGNTEALRLNGFFESALDNNKFAAKILKGGHKASAYFNIGSIEEERGHIKDSEDYYRLGLESMPEDIPPEARAYTLYRLANVCQLRGDDTEALKHYRLSLRVTEDAGLVAASLKSWMGIGIALSSLGEHQEASDSFGKCIELAVSQKDQRAQSQALYRQSAELIALKQIDDAIKVIDTCLLLTGELKDEPLRAKAIALKASTLKDTGLALKMYMEAKEILEEVGERFVLRDVLLKVGMLNRQKGDLKLAEASFRQCLKLATDQKDLTGTADSLFQLGVLYEQRADFDQSLDNFIQALKAREISGDKHGQAAALGQIGIIYRRKDDNKSAVRSLLLSASIFEALKSPYSKYAFEDLEQIEQELGEDAFKALHGEVMEELRPKNAS